MYKESGASIPPLTHHFLLGHEFCAMRETKRSLRLITAEKMIMIVVDNFFTEGNHANL
jgi:hypothetical protein